MASFNGSIQDDRTARVPPSGGAFWASLDEQQRESELQRIESHARSLLGDCASLELALRSGAPGHARARLMIGYLADAMFDLKGEIGRLARADRLWAARSEAFQEIRDAAESIVAISANRDALRDGREGARYRQAIATRLEAVARRCSYLADSAAARRTR